MVICCVFLHWAPMTFPGLFPQGMDEQREINANMPINQDYPLAAIENAHTISHLNDHSSVMHEWSSNHGSDPYQ